MNKENIMNKKIALILAFALTIPVVAGAEDKVAQNQQMRASMGVVTDRAGFQKMVDSSSEVYRSIASGPRGEVPSAILNNARCIGVLPGVGTGALIIGGTHGKGLVSCKNANKEWSQPAPIALNQGSIGLQAGAKSADLVLFFQTLEAEKALKRGEFTLGADVSAVAGQYDSKVDTSNAGVVVYSRAEGAYAGASVNSSKISKNQTDLESYYGKGVDFAALLEGRHASDRAFDSTTLTKLFP